MNRRPVVGCLLGVLLAAVQPLEAAPPPKPTVNTKAGSITALLPVAHIVRGSGKAQTSTDAKKGSELVWQDLVRTEKGGRARIQLLDESILSVGSQAELRIVQHDARSQQTSLALTYGRMRAEVTKITRDGGSFQLRTPTAVAGVIGTHFSSNASASNTDFVCFDGDTKIGNADPSVGGEEHCGAGDFVSVPGGKAPSKRKATPQEMQEALQETAAGVLSALAPGALLVGTAVDAVATGSNLGGVNKVTVAGGGVQARLNPGGTNTAVNVHIAADANAAPGPRTITFSRSKGADVVAVINIQGAPTGDAAALRKGYEDLIEQERTSALTALGGVADQIANQAAQSKSEIDSANKQNRDVSRADSDLQAQVDAVRSAAERARSAIEQAAGTAQSDLKARFDAAQQALNGRAPDEAFNQALAGAFNEVNGTLQGALRAAGEGLGGAANNASGNIAQITQNWLDQLRGSPAGGGALGEQSVEVGNSFRYTAPSGGGANITSYEWSLCAASGSCNPLPGFTSSAPDFTAVTCSLQPGDYRVRLVTTDASGNKNTTDTTLHVLPTAYDDPPTTLRNLADAYVALQSSRFLGYFDATQFSGYTQLQENVRRTFQTLASMNINLRISQAQVNCNDATVRADWEQNYSFQNNPNLVYHQVEQLSVRMSRESGDGWRIVDFQGDNGTVQGLPPGPQTSDAALPDIEVQITNVTSVSGAVPVKGARAQASRGPATTSNDPTPIPTGSVQVTATVTNVGKAPLTQTVKVRLSLTDSAGTEIGGTDVDVAPPLAPGQSVQVSGRITVPNLTPGTPGQLVGIGNPGCVVQTASCGTTSTDVVPVVIGNVDLAVQSFTATNLIGTLAGVVNVTIRNLGSTGSSPSSNNLVVTSADFPGFQFSAGIPAIPSGQSVVAPIPVIWPNGSGTHNFQVRITPAAQFDNNAANDTLTASLTLTAAQIDLSMVNLAFTAAGGPPFLAGQNRGVTFQVHNTGNVPSNAADTFACSLTGPLGTRSLGSNTIPVVQPNTTGGTITFNFVVPTNFAGANTLSCTINKDPLESSGALGNNSLTLAAQTNGNIDLTVPAPATQIIGQMGGAGTITIRVNNTGLDDAPAGYDVVLRINGSPVGSGTGPNVPAGGSALATVNVNVPQLAAAPADITGSLQVDVNTNNAVQETNTANNTLTTSIRLVDFTLTTLPTSTVQLINGRAASVPAVQINPASYPLTVTVSYTGAPSGLAASGANGTTLGGTVSSGPGPFTANITGTVGGVTHAANQPIVFQVLSEIAMNSSPVAVQAGGPTQALTVSVSGGIFPLQLSITLPGGISTPNPLTQVLNTPGNVTWNVQAATGLALGNLTAVVHATDGGIPTSNVPAGNVNFNATIIVTNAPPQANYVPLTMQIAGHGPAPFTGPNSLTVGESLNITVPVKNIGSLSPTGFIVVSIACIGACNPPFQTSVPAPAAGQTANAFFTIPSALTSQVPPGPYTATISLTTSITQSTADDSITIPVNVNAASGTPDFALQNVALGGTTTGRNTTTNPILFGETFQIGLTVNNHGTGPSLNPIEIGASIGGRLVGFKELSSSLAAGASTNVTMDVWMPDDPTMSNAVQVHLFVVSAQGETNLVDNFATLNVTASNWELVVQPGSPGESSANPIPFTPPAVINANTTIKARLVGGSGSLTVPLPISVSLTSTHITVPTFPAQLNAGNNFSGTVTVHEDALTPDALYYAQVVATLPAPTFLTDSNLVTTRDAKRGATIFINTIVLPAFTDSISINTNTGHNSIESPLQINGFLREPFSVTATRTSCIGSIGPPPPCPGTLDMTFVDQDQIITSPQQIKGVAWRTPAGAQAQATLDLDGFVVEGNPTSTVSAEAFSVSSARDNPQTGVVQPVGTLYYRIGDLLLNNGGACVRVPPGGSGSLAVNFIADNGFNIPTVNWAWETNEFPFAGGGLSVNIPTGSSTFTGNGYTALPTFQFNSSATAANAPLDLQSVFFDVTVTNGNDTVTATFLDLAVDMSAAGGLCGGGTAPGVATAKRGSWSRGASGSAARRQGAKRGSGGGLPDLSISAADVSFSPSLPRAGDTVAVRFRITNKGTGAAHKVPVALQVNGVTVASDTFDVAAGGGTLGALEWSNARVGGSRGRRGQRFPASGAGSATDAGAAAGGAVSPGLALNLAVVIDPERTLTQQTSGVKSVTVPHFVLRPDESGALADELAAAGPEQRLVVEVSESGCTGLRLSSGASGGCDNADVEFSVVDLGAGNYRLQSQNGIADLGFNQDAAAANASLAPFSTSATGLAGHTYAVRLNNGHVGMLTLRAIRNPRQLDARSRTVFTRNGAGQLIRQLGGGTGPVQPGDTSGASGEARVYFDVTFRGQ